MHNSDLPEAYRIGWVPFIHTKIWLDSRPLIPRTETEYWVNEVIKEIKQSGIARPRVLDLCAGSGVIGVAVAYEIPDARVDFVEIDPAHHETIRKNVRENNISAARVHIFGGNLFENLSDKYDFILSNPPYIDMSLGRVAEPVLAHEPRLALDGGRHGLEMIERILAEAPQFLAPTGSLWLEHEPEQVSTLATHPWYKDSYSDQFGVLRFSQFQGSI